MWKIQELMGTYVSQLDYYRKRKVTHCLEEVYDVLFNGDGGIFALQKVRPGGPVIHKEKKHGSDITRVELDKMLCTFFVSLFLYVRIH